MTMTPRTMTPRDLSGYWTLINFVYRWPDGRELAPFGAAQGQLIYLTASDGLPGRMAVQVVASERPPLDPKNETSLAAHFRSGFAYGGRWSLENATVHHDVDIASLAFWQGARLSREVSLENGCLRLSTDEPSPQIPEGGYTTVLEWTR